MEGWENEGEGQGKLREGKLRRRGRGTDEGGRIGEGEASGGREL